jgi:TRAP-type C4-dicarboxylate transport system permease small subunit
MALPIIIFVFLIAIAIGLFIFGASRESMNSGFAFIALSAVIFIISGLFIWTGGIQLDQVSTIDATTDIISLQYSELQATSGSPIWVIANIFVFGGMALIVLSLILTVRQRRQLSYETQLETS